MDIKIRQANEKDTDSVAELYDGLNDYLAATTNYPGWRKGAYPDRRDAADGIGERSLFVATREGEIVASMILRRGQEATYSAVTWRDALRDEDVLTLHTLAVRPDCLRRGIAGKLLAFAARYAADAGAKSLRLDVYEKNLPAIRLYERNGFQYVATVSLGLEAYGLDRFKLYEKPLRG